MDALWYWTKILWIPPFAISLINPCEHHKLALEGCTFHIHRFSWMPSSCLRGQHFPYLFILLMPRTCLRGLHFPYPFFWVPRTSLWGLQFPYPSIFLTAKNLPQKAALSISIYSLDCQELALEVCTFHTYLFSWLPRTCLWRLHFPYPSILMSAKDLL